MGAPLPTKFRIIVPAIGSRPIHAMPPGIVQEKSASFPLQRIIDEGRRVPVGRAIRPWGGKGRRVEFQKDMVCTRWCCQRRSSGHDGRVVDLYTVVIGPHPLL